ncbi:MAG: hypothetical protein JSU66_09740 [Deltaproteobacteria bacterium]|nr:MAG: hypothetical protein JSU66_09740 [Deltaproteobacteria bacterium]
MKREELAWGFAEIFSELNVEEINELLANNVPLETLDFFNAYAESFADTEELDSYSRQRLPNLLIVGYLLRLLEERLLREDAH